MWLANDAEDGRKSTKEATRAAFDAASARVAAIAGAMRRMDELLQQQQREEEDEDHTAKSRFKEGFGQRK